MAKSISAPSAARKVPERWMKSAATSVPGTACAESRGGNSSGRGWFHAAPALAASVR